MNYFIKNVKTKSYYNNRKPSMTTVRCYASLRGAKRALLRYKDLYPADFGDCIVMRSDNGREFGC